MASDREQTQSPGQPPAPWCGPPPIKGASSWLLWGPLPAPTLLLPPSRPRYATDVAEPYDEGMSSKQRLSASVDSELVAAAHAAVAEGRAESVSAWVNDALRRQLEHERRLVALGEYLAAYEAEHGEITEDEMRSAARHAESRAVVVRGGTAGTARSRSRST